MATVVLCPTYGVGYQGFGTNGLPLNGGFINTYAAGGSTPTATYTTSVGNVQNANPIQLGTDGRPPAEIWLLQGTAYKFVLTDSLGNIIKTEDNIPGIDDASAFIGTVPIANGGTAQTTTQAALDGLHQTPFTTSAAAALNLDTVSSDYVSITGNTAILTVSLAPGRERTLLFQSTVAVSSNSTLSLIGGTTITAVAGDTMILRGEPAGVVRSVVFQRASGMPSVATTVSNTLSSNVSLNNTGIYFDGPSVSAGPSPGTWLAIGNVCVTDTAGSAGISVKLWDGTVIQDAAAQSIIINTNNSISLAGVFINPTANIRISVRDASSTSGTINANSSGTTQDSTITLVRIG